MSAVPVTHYVLAVTTGVLATIAVALIVGATNPASFWPAAGIGALCATYPAQALGWKIFVSGHTLAVDAHGAESAEVRWMQQAASGAFVDVVVAGTIAAVVLLLTRTALEALPVLLALLGLAVADAALRYAIVRRRDLR